MPTTITQIEDKNNPRMILRVEGSLKIDDAELLEKIAHQISDESGKEITIDLADLDFLDSDAAPILRRIENTEGLEIQGLEIFLQTAVLQAESNPFQ